MLKPDHPLARSCRRCILCGKPKERGLVVCWPCYREHDLRNGNDDIEMRIDQFEADLAEQMANTPDTPSLPEPYPY